MIYFPFFCSNMRGVFILFLICLHFSAFSQPPKKERVPSYFGLQVKPVFPTRFIGNSLTEFRSGTDQPLLLETKIQQKVGYSFGATVRAGLTKLIALETGINFTQRNFDLEMSLPDSNIVGKNTLSFIDYDIPINALFYIRLAEKWYMNASLGVAVTFAPTHVEKETNPESIHNFKQTGFVPSKVGADANANIGFEFRTEKSGFFYIGGSGRVPFKPIFTLYSEHHYQGYHTYSKADVDGSYLSIDFKYFFPNIANKGTQFKPGPINQ